MGISQDDNYIFLNFIFIFFFNLYIPESKESFNLYLSHCTNNNKNNKQQQKSLES